MSTTEINPHTRKKVSDRQYRNMGKLNVTSPEKSILNIEKTFALPETMTGLIKSEEKAQKEPSSKDRGTTASPKAKVKITPKPARKEIAPVNEKYNEAALTRPQSETGVIVNAVLNAQSYIVDAIDKKFEERLEKLDEAILELINCKAENERLKQKVDNYTRENFKLKREVASFKQVVPGLYIKKNKETSGL